jgi:2-polyprenyl-3-methyl-5-hydroxy-6-metoxy-1,4-benzoquinol methylase
MGLIDYSGQDGNVYHRVRHREIFGNAELISAWGAYAAAVYFRGVKPHHRILEIGAGTGINVAGVSRTAAVTAVEPAEEAREHCKKLGIRCFRSLEDLPAGQAYDFVLMRHVLEHVEDPCALLRQARELLETGGRAVIVVPVEWPYKRINRRDIDHHLYGWNRQTLV